MNGVDKGLCLSTEVDMSFVLPGEAYNTLSVVCDGCVPHCDVRVPHLSALLSTLFGSVSINLL